MPDSTSDSDTTRTRHDNAQPRHHAGRHRPVPKTAIAKAQVKQKIKTTAEASPAVLEAGRKSKEVIIDKVVPGLQQGAKVAPKVMKQELGKMHRKQHFWERFKSALMHKSLGLVLAMFSADIIGQIFETRRANNLWGLTSKHELVSNETFAVLTFIVEFIIALIVFTITDYYLDEWREKRQRKAQANKS